MSWAEHHSRSEEFASRAELAMLSGDRSGAQALYLEAAREEVLAFEALPEEKKRTRGITAVSAVALCYKGGDFQTARWRAGLYLERITLPEFARRQLEDLLKLLPPANWGQPTHWRLRRSVGIERTAERAIDEIYRRFWEGPIPVGLGTKLYRSADRLARLHGLDEVDGPSELFQRFLQEVLSYFERHDPNSIRDPKNWLQGTLRLTAVHQAKDEKRWKKQARLAGVPGEEAMSDEVVPDLSIEELRTAIQQLEPTYRVFLELDLLEQLPPEAIVARLEPQSMAGFRKLQTDAVKELRKALLEGAEYRWPRRRRKP